MSEVQDLLEMLQDSDASASRLQTLLQDDPDNEINKINAFALQKRRKTLAKRLTAELRRTQADLVQYHVDRPEDRYPVLAIAKAIQGFQELVTSVFDAIRGTPKQRYRPSAENIALSTLDFGVALPVGSVLVSMSVENERLIAVKSELDEAFDRVFEILNTREPESLRDLAEKVGIASIAKAHDWASTTSQFGLNTKISVMKDMAGTQVDFAITKLDAQLLKETIEEKSDRKVDPEVAVGELVGIDIDSTRDKSRFHLRTRDGRDLQGKLDDAFPRQAWTVDVEYTARLVKLTTIKYATGEETIEWLLAALSDAPPIEAELK